MAKNQLISLNEIFTNRLFRIPDYQRGYAWKADKQIKDFWDDIVNLPQGRSHYTGMLSIKEVEESIWSSWPHEEWIIRGKKYVPYHVVDGQQRLTTFVIFVKSIIDLLTNLPENAGKKDEDIDLGEFSLKEVKELYIVEKKRKDIINTYKFGYEEDNSSFRFLKHKILGEPNAGTIDETFYTLNLENAKRFFDENVMEYFNDHGMPGINQLFEKATQFMMFNIHDIDDDFDVFVAFETMNNRGKKLSNLEMMKSRLIYLTTLFDSSQLDNNERAVIREKINNAWKEVYYQLGRNKLHPLSDDEFLRAHWIMRYTFSNKRGDDYISFLLNKKFVTKNIFENVKAKMSGIIEAEEKSDLDMELEEDDVQVNDVDSNGKERKLTPKYIVDYAESLKEAARYWYITYFPEDSNEISADEKKWLARLNRVGIAYFRPLLVASYLTPKTNCDDRVKLFREVERFILIALRMSGAYSTYNQNQVNRMVRHVYSGEITLIDVANRIRSRVEGWVHPSTQYNYHPFKAKIQRLYQDGGGYYDWGALRYLLYEYEDDLVQQNGNAQKALNFFVKSERDKTSIEHIFPQTPTKSYWKKQFKGYNEQQKAFLAGSLGNLLPLSLSVNSSLQNDAFPDKKKNKTDKKGNLLRRGYAFGSHSETEVAGYEEWNPEAIMDRGIKLLKFMERRWDIKFENEDAMLDLLFIDFVKAKKKPRKK